MDTTEKLQPLAQLAAQHMRCPVSKCTLRNYVRHGVLAPSGERVYLQATVIGGAYHATEADFRTFLESLRACPGKPGTARRPGKTSAAAEAAAKLAAILGGGS